MQNTDYSARGTIERLHLTADAAEMAEHVTARLGPDVEITLEVRARNDDGFYEATRRTVSENAIEIFVVDSDIAVDICRAAAAESRGLEH